jgi:hypothetical protein
VIYNLLPTEVYRTESQQSVIDFEGVAKCSVMEFYRIAGTLGVHPTAISLPDRKKLMLQAVFKTLDGQFRKDDIRHSAIYVQEGNEMIPEDVTECLKEISKVFPVAVCCHKRSFKVFYEGHQSGDRLEVCALLKASIDQLDDKEFSTRSQKEFCRKHALDLDGSYVFRNFHI